jgi:hypothetical protein
MIGKPMCCTSAFVPADLEFARARGLRVRRGANVQVGLELAKLPTEVAEQVDILASVRVATHRRIFVANQPDAYRLRLDFNRRNLFDD